MTALSPMKKGKSCQYFDGEIADGSSRMRVVGFDANIRKKLQEFYDESDAVALSL